MSEPQGKVFKQITKGILAAVVSAVAVPYTLAVFTNMLYGWPIGPNRYKKALHPKKVYNLNYAILQQVANLRYAKLFFSWKRFYSIASKTRLIKDIPYGNNNNCLDVYLPWDHSGHLIEGYKPAVIFVYGGSWGSGDKSMYCLLCKEVADMLGTVVVCPNYSTYPKGYVDDMVQDLVDCLSWIHFYGHEYGIEKERIMFLGHSAGAHLCAMATVELVMKRLLTHPDSLTQPTSETSRQSSVLNASMRFVEEHFNGSSASENGTEDDNNVTIHSEEDTVIQEQVEPTSQPPDTASTTGSFYFVNDKSKSQSDSLMDLDDDDHEPKEKESRTLESTVEEESLQKSTESERIKAEEGDNSKEKSLEFEDNEKRILDLSAFQDSEMETKSNCDIEKSDGETDMTLSQREVRDLLSSIKVVVGLAGVYHIGEHFQHEAWRGVEDVSSMAKAMYGPEFFDRFSPTHIIPNLPKNTRFPAMYLLHGDQDSTVPYTSSTKLGEAMWKLGSRNVQVSVLPGCDHTDMCLDLMSRERAWYDPVMATIMEAANRHL